MIYKILFFIMLFFISSCASFIEEQEIEQLQLYQNRTYTMKKDISAGKYSLKKAQKIKLFIITDDEYIKVYGYSEDVDFVKAERVLLLYLFEDDFKNTKYDKKYFEEKLFDIIAPSK